MNLAARGAVLNSVPWHIMRTTCPRAREGETQALGTGVPMRVAIPPVMAITKCPIPTPPMNRFTVRRDVLRQCGRTSERMVHAA
jgi:hypothetical protein